MAKRIVDMDALTHAVEEFGREVRELSAMNLATSSDVLVVLAGESMRGKSDRRSAFAEDVERAIREVISNMTNEADRRVAEIMLASAPRFYGTSVTESVGWVEEHEGRLVTSESYWKRRRRVLPQLVGGLVQELDLPGDPNDLDQPSQADDGEPGYPKWVLKAADQLVLHLQELGCYVFGYLHLADELIRVSNENADRYQAWRRRLAEPDLAARLSMYEYVAVADILSDLQARPAGRAFLRDTGLGEFAFAAGNTGDIVEWSWIAVEVGGFGGNRREFFNFLDDDPDGREELERWHRELTGHTESYERTPAWVEGGHGSLQFLGHDISRILAALFDTVPEAFASVSEIRERAEDHVRQLCARRRYAALHPGEWVDAAPVDELRSWNVEQLWDALTLYRHVEYKPEAREMLPTMPHLGLELVGPTLPDDE